MGFAHGLGRIAGGDGLGGLLASSREGECEFGHGGGRDGEAALPGIEPGIERVLSRH